MRIRSTKPEFWKSERVASLSWEDRFLLKGLESYVDDNGVGRDDVALIVGDVFARDMFASPRETVARVSEGLPRIESAGLIHRYVVEGTAYLYVSFWESIQRIDKPGRGRMPRPDGTFDYGDSIIRESVASPRESVAPGTVEQGNRGTGEQTTPKGVVAPRKRGTRIPEPFVVTADMRQWASTEVPTVDVDRSTRTFVNYWRAKTRDATKLDWRGTWENWLLKDQSDADKPGRRPTPTERAQQTAAAGRAVAGHVITTLEPKGIES